MATVDRDHPIVTFRNWMDAHLPPEIHPAGELVPIAGRFVSGVAAFPGSHGLYAPCGSDPTQVPPFPFGGLMAVGNHLDSETKYEERRLSGQPHGDPCPGARRMTFWNALYALLDAAGVPREELFATNVHPALRAGASAIGNVRRSAPGYAEWMLRCANFLRLQIDVMRSRVVVAMGVDAARFLSFLFDVEAKPMQPPLRVAIDDVETTFVAVAHPSARPVTMAARRYGRAVGRAADEALLRDAWEMTV